MTFQYDTRMGSLARQLASVAGLVMVLTAGAALLSTSTALASSAWWQLSTRSFPATLPKGGEATIYIVAVNMGDAPMSGPIALSDELPAGVTVESVSYYAEPFLSGGLNIGFLCTTAPQTATCPYSDSGEYPFLAVAPYENLNMRVVVNVDPGFSGGTSHAEVTGGGIPAKTDDHALTVGSGQSAFAVERFEVAPEEEGGGVDAQAGSHPFQLSTTLSFDQGADPAKPPALLRNVHVELPPGLIGNAAATPQCSELDFSQLHEGGMVNSCPATSAIGVAVLTVYEPLHLGLKTLPVPVFNLAPGRGEPARFGFEFANNPVILDTSVRTGGDYGVNVDVSNVSELANVISSTVAIWGVPGDPVHNESRGWTCLASGVYLPGTGLACELSHEAHPAPFLSLPTSCTTQFSSDVEAVSWPTREEPQGIAAAPAEYSLHDEFGRPLSPTGCNRVPFDPSLEVSPDVQSPSTASGLTVRVHVPQEANESATGIASAAIKDTTVTLPAGLELNAAAANGLQACSEGEVGFTGIGGDGTDLFTPTLPSPFCPAAAKVGTVTLKTPILPNPLEGSVYLAAQTENPFGSLVAMYVIAEDPTSGVLVKLAGEVHLGETGQITTTLRNSPQAPVEEAEFHFFGGDRAALETPAQCGDYKTSASFEPWSQGAPVQSSSTFQITGCSGPQPFAPVLSGGSASAQAGAFTPLTTSVARADGSQEIQGIQLRMPPGFAGMISSVTPCAEAQANAGTCGPASLIGHTSVSVGVGNEPFTVTGGQVFITGPYQGAPFGLSIVVPAKAGPFDLGTVVVRARLNVDPRTAQVTVTTDEAGAHAIPRYLQGIPVQIKHVDVTVDRAGFAYNPTNCDQLAIQGTIASNQGASAAVSTPFQVANCANLKFSPRFTATTSGKVTRARGTSLTLKVTRPSGPGSGQANFSYTKIALPRQLPSRLTTLRRACLAAQFDANPAGCPAGSMVGHVRVRTPILPVPLEGPAYFVSHGGEAFPNLVFVLQGDGVTIDVVSDTFISKAGITTGTLKAVPDAPFTSFELTLPAGPDSVFTGIGNLCKHKLAMPTVFKAQNGAEVRQTTRIAVTGCASRHAARSHRSRGKRARKGGHG
jgi:hypothetical protein